MMKHLKIILFVWFTGRLMLLTSCKPEVKQAAPASFCLSDSMKKMVETDTAFFRTLVEELKLNAKVSFDEDKVVPIFSAVGGTVTDVEVELGDYVKRGQVLTVIKSGRLAEYSQQSVTARSNFLLAQKNLNIKEELFKDGLASKAEVGLAEKEVQIAQAELNRIEEINKLYNVNPNSEYVVRSPVEGFVVEKKVAREMQIRDDRTEGLFTISSLSDVWVLADVYQTDIAKVKIGYPAKISTVSYPDKAFYGTIDKIFNVLEDQSPAMKVRIRLQNPDFLLKPGMFCSVQLHFDRSETMVSVPSKSVIFDKNKNYVMIYKGPCAIETREIVVHSSVGSFTYISSGLSSGEKVLSKFHLLVYDALND